VCINYLPNMVPTPSRNGRVVAFAYSLVVGKAVRLSLRLVGLSALRFVLFFLTYTVRLFTCTCTCHAHAHVHVRKNRASTSWPPHLFFAHMLFKKIDTPSPPLKAVVFTCVGSNHFTAEDAEGAPNCLRAQRVTATMLPRAEVKLVTCAQLFEAGS